MSVQQTDGYNKLPYSVFGLDSVSFAQFLNSLTFTIEVTDVSILILSNRIIATMSV